MALRPHAELSQGESSAEAASSEQRSAGDEGGPCERGFARA